MDWLLNTLKDLGPLMTVTIILATAILTYWTFLRENRTQRLLNKFPGPPALPLLGNAKDLMDSEKSAGNMLGWRAKYGKRFRFYMGSEPWFLTVDPVDLEKILTSNVIIDKAIAYDLIGNWLGRGNLLLSTGKRWHTKRKLLTPAFHFKILDTFQPIFHEQSQVFVDVLKENSAKGDPINIEPFITRCTLDIICETAMGKKLNCQRDLRNSFAEATAIQTNLFWDRFTRPWLYPNLLWNLSSLGRKEKRNLKILHDFADQVIQERKAEFLREQEEEKKKPLATIHETKSSNEDEEVFLTSKKKFAFLDLLIRLQADNTQQTSTGPVWTDREIREETDTFMFEGHDTTSAGTLWAVYLLGLHPEYQAQLHEELDSIFGDDRRRPVTVSDLTRMKFLECCVKESLRIYPSVPLISRHLFQDFQLDEKTVIPKGVNIMISPLLIGREAQSFPDPEEYRPSRFLSENSSKRHPYSFVAFSAGPRNCVGQRFAYMEEKTMLANLFRNFKVVSTQSREEVRPLTEVILKPKNGLWVKLTPR